MNHLFWGNPLYLQRTHPPSSFLQHCGNKFKLLFINSREVIWLLLGVPLRTAFLIVCCFLLTGSLLKLLLILLCLQPVPWKTLRPCSSKHPQALQVATCLRQSSSSGPAPSFSKITLILSPCQLENLTQYTCKSQPESRN